jgi:hypothetical protein
VSRVILCIFGSRDYEPENFEIENAWHNLASDCGLSVEYPHDVIVGGSGKSDLAGERWARSIGVQPRIMYADWQRFGSGAGPKRNAEMAMFATHGIGFWKGGSRGTANMAASLLLLEKPVILRGARQ